MLAKLDALWKLIALLELLHLAFAKADPVEYLCAPQNAKWLIGCAHYQ